LSCSLFESSIEKLVAKPKIEKWTFQPWTAFTDRRDAGRRLAEFIDEKVSGDQMVLSLPRGGVPVGAPLAEKLKCPLGLVGIRKLPIPSSPEMGFGAVGLDGTLELNRYILDQLDLGQATIDQLAAEVTSEARRRMREYTGSENPPAVAGKKVYLVDDGLATGFTMIAAAKMVRRGRPARLIAAVPVSPSDSVLSVAPHFDQVYCLIVQNRPPFAVASYYQDFRELTDEEIKRILKLHANLSNPVKERLEN